MCHAADMSPANLRRLDSRALVTWRSHETMIRARVSGQAVVEEVQR